eukprot:CAMPEP_0178717996 /NCGR_PEP_ID=MMETSP0699-20121125/22268_1 /TAXON_ID=265572 /ORGANISM="Extubocellulus spinifer, Strain CCMP396" /LENGTH=38 /DNA_ID= /DNA_START= /DNA_END= /DNA_ORIENTATION=
MANPGNPRIISLEEGWNEEIKKKVRERKMLSVHHGDSV